MSISKKERSFSIWIGIAIGVALSSMLVRYALEKKETQTKERPGNYESLQCASGGEPFYPLPEPIKEKIPYGIVVYFENNQSTEDFNQTVFQRSWVIESSGSFRSERLFILAQEQSSSALFDEECEYYFYRASEVYLLPHPGVTKEEIEQKLDPEQYKIIGQHSKTGEWILQIKDFAPTELRSSLSGLSKLTRLISSVQLIHWTPSR